MISEHKQQVLWSYYIKVNVFITNFPQQTLSMIQTVCNHVPAKDTYLHAAYLQGNFLSSRLTALTEALYSSPLFILKGSSAHSRLIRIITPPLLVFIIQFPSSLLLSATHCQSATLYASPSPSTVKLFSLCSIFKPCCHPARSFSTQFITGHFLYHVSTIMPLMCSCALNKRTESLYMWYC